MNMTPDDFRRTYGLPPMPMPRRQRRFGHKTIGLAVLVILLGLATMLGAGWALMIVLGIFGVQLGFWPSVGVATLAHVFFALVR